MLDVNDFIADRGGNPEKIKCVLPRPSDLSVAIVQEARD